MYGILAGQLAIVALAIFVATYALLEADRPVAAGLVCSLLAYKPQMLVVLPIFFVVTPRARRALIGLALGGAAQLAACFAIAPDATLAFPSAVARMSAYVETHFRPSLGFTWRAFFTLLAPGHHALANALGAIAACACAIVATVAMVRSRGDLPRAVFHRRSSRRWRARGTARRTTGSCSRCRFGSSLRASSFLQSKSAARVLAFILPWGFVAIADAIGFHPAMPFLCVVAVWMLRRARRELQLGAS